MSSNRMSVLLSILKGLLIAVLFTLLCMLIISVLTLFSRISDSLLLALNQIVKLLAIALGVRHAVGRGGQRGFVTGMVVALLYMIAGYVMYVCLGGAHSIVTMLGEMLLGAAIGGVCGAIYANMSPRSKRKTRPART